MAFQRGPHVREIFVAKDNIASGRFQYDKKENQSNFNIKSKDKDSKKQNGKSKPTKLLSYKPKILSETDEVNVPVPTSSIESSNSIQRPRGPYIMGDKDVPIVLHPFTQDDDDALFDSPETLQQTANPIFDNNESGTMFKHSKTTLSETEIIDGIVIPAPDYDEEVCTMNFSEEAYEEVDFNKPVHRDYGGEDFSKFLKDDDEPHGGLTWHTQRPSSRNTVLDFDKKAKTEAKRINKYQKREPKRNSDKKSKGTVQRRNSLRTFSFADSKFVDTDTSRSSDTKDKSKKEMEFTVYGDADHFLDSNNKSYEAFLDRRHGNIPKETFIDSPGENKNVPQSPSDKDPNFWKRLTLRFKRQSSYNMSTVD